MKTQGSQIFLWFAVLVLLATVGWLVWPSPYQVCHIVLTGMGRARIYPTVAKFKPYKGKTMGGSALMAAVVKEQTASFTAKAEPYCFISLGAELSGTAEGFLTKGEAIVKAFNSMKLDAMLVGNIDFSFGKERLKELAQIANFKFVASNVKNTQGGHTPDFFKDSQIINISDNIKIGLLGLTPPDTPNLAAKEAVEDLDFLAPEAVLREKVEALRQDGADIVALMTQYNKEYITAEQWLTIASAAPDICFMLDTDMETPVPFAKDGVIIYSISSYNQTKEIDILDLEIIRKKPIEIVGLASHRLGVNMAEYDEDPETNKVVEDATAGIRAMRDTYIGTFASDYAKSYYGECPFGDFLTDSMRFDTGAQIAMQNSGSIQGNVSEGRFTMGDLYSIMPFDNKIVTMKLKGADILELLNISASRQRGILQVSGMEYAYYYRSRNDYGLKYARINGEEIASETLYLVAANNFLVDGGDNYLPFQRGQEVVVGRSQREVVREQIAALSASAPVILKTDGRIVVEEN